MGIRLKRKPFKIGSSWVVTLPQNWCEYYRERIKTVTIVGHSILMLAPEGMEERALKITRQEEENAD